MPEPMELETEQWLSWKAYRDAGGGLEIQEWIAAGMPSVSEERAAFAELNRLDEYLNLQYAQGFIEESEYDVWTQEYYDRLFGKGKYEGKRQTVAQLTGPVITDARDWWSGLPAEAQKRLEQQQRELQQQKGELQQQKEDIGRQVSQLPLYAKGTIDQQIMAGQQAIQQLLRQRQISPEHVKPIINSQIAQLQDAVRVMTEDMRARTRRATAEREGIPEEQIIPGGYAKQFAETYGMSPEAAYKTAQRYASMPESEEWRTLSSGQKEELRRVGYEEHFYDVPEIPITPYSPPGFEEVGATGAPAWKSWFESNYPSIVREFKGKPAKERTEGGWSEFLENERTRIREEFAKQGPYYRGERPGAFAPRIKTVAY
uniref:Uncharacterized protein n=1 Tax=viral metagenome TaxID=1070528 RepID=A0A6M3KXR7_9ZZZZ